MTNYITKEAAKRILKVKTVYEVKIVNNAVLVVYYVNGGKAATFLSQKAFTQDANALREAGTSDIKILKLNLSVGFATVLNTKKATEYLVDFKYQQCSCYDCRVNGNKCKHIRAVEAALPF